MPDHCANERQAWIAADQAVTDNASARDQNKAELDAVQAAYDASVLATDQAAIDAGEAYRTYLACVTGQAPPEPMRR